MNWMAPSRRHYYAEKLFDPRSRFIESKLTMISIVRSSSNVPFVAVRFFPFSIWKIPKRLWNLRRASPEEQGGSFFRQSYRAFVEPVYNALRSDAFRRVFLCDRLWRNTFDKDRNWNILDIGNWRREDDLSNDRMSSSYRMPMIG